MASEQRQSGGQTSGAGTAQSGGSGAPAKAGESKPRSDSTTCPRCGKPGAPAVGGTRRSETTVTQYRQCADKGCGHKFKETQLLEGGKPAGESFVSG